MNITKSIYNQTGPWQGTRLGEFALVQGTNTVWPDRSDRDGVLEKVRSLIWLFTISRREVYEGAEDRQKMTAPNATPNRIANYEDTDADGTL